MKTNPIPKETLIFIVIYMIEMSIYRSVALLVYSNTYSVSVLVESGLLKIYLAPSAFSRILSLSTSIEKSVNFYISEQWATVPGVPFAYFKISGPIEAHVLYSKKKSQLQNLSFQ